MKGFRRSELQGLVCSRLAANTIRLPPVSSRLLLSLESCRCWIFDLPYRAPVTGLAPLQRLLDLRRFPLWINTNSQRMHGTFTATC